MCCPFNASRNIGQVISIHKEIAVELCPLIKDRRPLWSLAPPWSPSPSAPLDPQHYRQPRWSPSPPPPSSQSPPPPPPARSTAHGPSSLPACFFGGLRSSAEVALDLHPMGGGLQLYKDSVVASFGFHGVANMCVSAGLEMFGEAVPNLELVSSNALVRVGIVRIFHFIHSGDFNQISFL